MDVAVPWRGEFPKEESGERGGEGEAVRLTTGSATRADAYTRCIYTRRDPPNFALRASHRASCIILYYYSTSHHTTHHGVHTTQRMYVCTSTRGAGMRITGTGINIDTNIDIVR